VAALHKFLITVYFDPDSTL